MSELSLNENTKLKASELYLIALAIKVNPAELFKDPAMLKRFQDIATLPEKEKECLLTTVDHFIKASKISLM